MTKKVYNFGVIGCGSIAEIAHLPAIKNTARANLEAVMDINEDEVKKVAGKWDAKKWFTDYHKMLESCELDAVVISSPPRFH